MSKTIFAGATDGGRQGRHHRGAVGQKLQGRAPAAEGVPVARLVLVGGHDARLHARGHRDEQLQAGLPGAQVALGAVDLRRRPRLDRRFCSRRQGRVAGHRLQARQELPHVAELDRAVRAVGILDVGAVDGEGLEARAGDGRRRRRGLDGARDGVHRHGEDRQLLQIQRHVRPQQLVVQARAGVQGVPQAHLLAGEVVHVGGGVLGQPGEGLAVVPAGAVVDLGVGHVDVGQRAQRQGDLGRAHQAGVVAEELQTLAGGEARLVEAGLHRARHRLRQQADGRVGAGAVLGIAAEAMGPRAAVIPQHQAVAIGGVGLERQLDGGGQHRGIVDVLLGVDLERLVDAPDDVLGVGRIEVPMCAGRELLAAHRLGGVEVHHEDHPHAPAELRALQRVHVLRERPRQAVVAVAVDQDRPGRVTASRPVHRVLRDATVGATAGAAAPARDLTTRATRTTKTTRTTAGRVDVGGGTRVRRGGRLRGLLSATEGDQQQEHERSAWRQGGSSRGMLGVESARACRRRPTLPPALSGPPSSPEAERDQCGQRRRHHTQGQVGRPPRR
jgi:hypothetical protein